MKFYNEGKIIFYLNTHSSCARQLLTNSGNFLFPQERIEGEIMVQTSKTTWCMCNLPIKRMRKHETKDLWDAKNQDRGKKGSKHRHKNTRFMWFTQIINGASTSSTMKIIKGVTRFFFFFFDGQESNIIIIFDKLGKKVMLLLLFFDKLGKKVILLKKK